MMSVSRGRFAPLLICVALVVLFAHLTGCGKKDQPVETAAVTRTETVPEPAAPVEPTTPAPEPPPAEPTQPAPPAPEPASPPETQPEAQPAQSEVDVRASTEAATPPPPVEAGKPQAAPAPTPKPEPGKNESAVVIGTVTLVSQVPDPSSVPYKDCTTYIKYQVESVESGDYDGAELVAVHWGMKEKKLQPPASFTPGQKHRLTIDPFANHPKLTRLQTADDTDDYTSTPYWVESYSSE